MNTIRWIVAISILNVFVFAGTLSVGLYLQGGRDNQKQEIAVIKQITHVQVVTPEVIQPTSEPAPPEPTKDTRCIISVDGSSYDVTSFRSSHSGGDIFTCGTDMSAVFHGQHAASYLSQMAQYKL